MNDQRFKARLSQELPRWRRAGWVSAENELAILADLDNRQSKVAWAGALGLGGALLLGVGAIMWFAAHWVDISKLVKLLLIFSALIASHLSHGICVSRQAMPKLAQAMAFLSLLFFGAAIMLIGQIYHIDAHFPDGIALWAAGGLLTAWLLHSHPAMIASIGLAAIWTIDEQFTYRAMNWPILVYLTLAAIPVIRRNWTLAARALGALLILWMLGWHSHPWLGSVSDTGVHLRLFALQVLGLAGWWAFAQASNHPLARAIREDLLLLPLLGAFAFTYPKFGDHSSAINDLYAWLAALCVALLIYVAGIVRLIRASDLAPSRLRIGIALATIFAVMVGIKVVVPANNTLIALLWNATFLASLYWLGDMGMRKGDRSMLNRVFIGFALWVLARYFDSFWTLLDRSLFFMAGGALLIGGGGWLERRRRTLMQNFDSPGQP